MATIKSIEEKAKAYDEAIERAKKHCADYVVETIFPELKESEDDKTKRILHSISSKISFHLRDIFTEEEFQCFDTWSNSWLEKQGEQILANSAKTCKDEQKSLVIPKFRKGDFIRYKTNPDDVERVDCVMDDYYILDIKGECTHVLFTCQDLWELVEQKTAWSEEGERIIDNLISQLGNLYIRKLIKEETKDKYVNWLKSLRPQSHWKPSEEQMKALEHAINCYSGISPTNTEEVYTLEIMKEQLKKLKE